MAVPNSSYSEISSITEKYFVPKMYDQIFNSNALFQRARKKIEIRADGGERVIVPLLYATTTAAGKYTGAGTLDTSANDQITAAEFTWKQYYANITITRLDELKNKGKSQIINFVKAKVQAAEKTLADTFGTDLFGTSSTNSIIGLESACAGTGTTYGGISKTTYSWWRGQTDAATTTLSIAALRAIIGDATVDSDRPTVIVGLQDWYDDLYGQIQPGQRFTDSETAKAGFRNIMFEGIPFIVDSHCGSTDLFALNENYLHLIVHEDENFRFEAFTKPINQNVSSAKIYWAGVFACSNPRMQGWMSALT